MDWDEGVPENYTLEFNDRDSAAKIVPRGGTEPQQRPHSRARRSAQQQQPINNNNNQYGQRQLYVEKKKPSEQDIILLLLNKDSGYDWRVRPRGLNNSWDKGNRKSEAFW